jgi:DNA-binding NarL/FixJ family response regulator
VEKEEVKMKEQCCFTCGKLYAMTCEDCLTYKCRKYEPVQLDKMAISTKYIEAINKLLVDVRQLQLIEMEMKVAEKIKAEGKEVKEPERQAISKRNKEIIALIEQGKGVKEIAQELNLKPETVEKELEYLLKNRMVKNIPS